MSEILEDNDIVINKDMVLSDGKPHVIKADKITFDGGAIITKGTDLTLSANELVVTDKKPTGGYHIQILGIKGTDGKPGKNASGMDTPASSGHDAKADNPRMALEGTNEYQGNGDGWPSICCTRPATDGSNGSQGHEGGAGQPAGDGIKSGGFTLSIQSVSSDSQSLSIYNISGQGGTGGTGGKGGTGQQGGDGGNGCQGLHGSCMGGANGGNGGTGGTGGTGGNGGKSAHGSPISITFPDKAKKLLIIKQDETPYGQAGKGGIGGDGAAGGKGGKVINYRTVDSSDVGDRTNPKGFTWCKDGDAGSDGSKGTDGKKGEDGPTKGLPGEVVYHWITEK